MVVERQRHTAGSAVRSLQIHALLVLSLSAWLSACSSPPSTPYLPMRDGHGPFGYSSESMGDHLFRVEFWGSAKTPARTAYAFALFRAAELAYSLDMKAFTVEKGPIDRSVLEGADTFSANEWVVPQLASQEAIPSVETRRIQTATISVPIYIETPEARDARTASKLVILRVRMHPERVESKDPRQFATEDVLRRLGPRIVHGQPT